MARGNAIRIFRQLTVAIVAIAFTAGVWQTQVRVSSWKEPLWVTIYPALADDDPATEKYVTRLSRDDFSDITDFVRREAHRYGVGLDDPLHIELGQRTDLPPAPPENGNPLRVMAWSLQLRWWAWRELADQPGPEPDIRMFVVFHKPVTGVALPHSLGLRKALTGIAHVFASRQMRGANHVVITHELMHTVGASDKYGPDDLPVFPDGYAEPDRKPLYPQRYAEIMGGRIPLARDRARIPPDLHKVRIGPATAAEIHWISRTPADDAS